MASCQVFEPPRPGPGLSEVRSLKSLSGDERPGAPAGGGGGGGDEAEDVGFAGGGEFFASEVAEASGVSSAKRVRV